MPETRLPEDEDSLPPPSGLRSILASCTHPRLLNSDRPNMRESPSTQGEPSTSGAVDDSHSADRVEDSQIFLSVPALNQAASYLAQTASFLTQCLPVPGYVGLSEEGQELVTLPPASAAGRLSVQTSSEESACTNSPLVQADCSGSPSQQNSGQMVPSHVFQNGSSLFQGLVERARKTVRGSADDIGWLERDQSLPTTEDGTARFLEILESVRKNEHRLPDSVVYLLPCWFQVFLVTMDHFTLSRQRHTSRRWV